MGLRDNFGGITPEQYHVGLDKLWAAMGITGVQDKDVFTLASEQLALLRAEHEALKLWWACPDEVPARAMAYKKLTDAHEKYEAEFGKKGEADAE